MWMGGIMKHLTNLAIAAGVFIFTKLYAGAISFNSVEIIRSKSGWPSIGYGICYPMDCIHTCFYI